MTHRRRTFSKPTTTSVLVLIFTILFAPQVQAGLLDSPLSPIVSLLGAVTSLLLGKASDDIVQLASGPPDVQGGAVAQTYGPPEPPGLNSFPEFEGTATAH